MTSNMSSTTSSSSRSSKRRVRFSRQNSYQQGPAMDNDASQLWYSADFIRTNLEELGGETAASEDATACPCLSQESRQRRANHVKHVLSMQDEMVAQGTGSDATGLKAFCAALSKEPVKDAIARAQEHSKLAFQVYQEAQFLPQHVSCQDFVGISTCRRGLRRKSNNSGGHRLVLSQRIMVGPL